MVSIRELIILELEGCVQDDSLNKQENKFSDTMILLETGLDSLGFAVLVTRLEMMLGYDPFTLEQNPFYPKTLGEFISIYEKYEDFRKNE